MSSKLRVAPLTHISASCGTLDAFMQPAVSQLRVTLGLRLVAALGCTVLLLTAAFALPRSASAQSLHVATLVDPCVPLDRDKFEYLLNIELGAEPADEASPPAATLSLSCSGSLILLSVEDAVTSKVVTRLVDLSVVDPSARARLMALTASELVLASWMEVRMEPRVVIPPAGPPPAPELKARVSEVVQPQIQSSAPLRLGASAMTSTFLSALAPIFGLALHLTQPFSSSWAWDLRVLGGLGQLSGTVGDDGPAVSIAVTTAALAWSLRYTGSAGPFDLWVGLGGLVGLAYLAGERPAASTLTATPGYAPWAGPALQLAAAYPVSPSFRLLLQLEAGLLALGARARVRSENAGAEPVVTQLRGGWLAAQLGFDFAL
jgi:hypothetical protein